MRRSLLKAGGRTFPLIVVDAAVVGSGCAGFNAADWLYDLGRRDLALFTEGRTRGTSRNTGSDKQTYYKLSLAGEDADSVRRMARDLFAGGGVNGDTALAEAANSVRSFAKLANLGVPFPTNAYGEYVGYKTDHDPVQRGTSAGPLTSKYMTEALERAVREKQIPILDGFTVVQLLVWDGVVQGMLCLDAAALAGPSHGLTVVAARHVILATGGPAGCYARSVYPYSQTGMSGMALEAGAKGANLDQWQYGLASTKFRWNVSGTYQQVLPRYFSVDADGTQREFLADAFGNPAAALDFVFQKGYQWPFDTEKLSGSSQVDLLVYRECERGRRVYLDYRTEPKGLERGFGVLGEEARTYLQNSGALLPTPVARLRKMNPLAIDLYRQHGIDLCREPLEIAVCAQHHNGGIAVDADWQTDVAGLYVAGEAAGTFGAARPGGSALNSTQVGSMRAAQHIARTTSADTAPDADFAREAGRRALALAASLGQVRVGGDSNLRALRRRAQARMSSCAAQVRVPGQMERLRAENAALLADFYATAQIRDVKELPALLQLRDTLVTQCAVLCAMQEAARTVGSCGSALVAREGQAARGGVPAHVPHRPLPENALLETQKTGQGFQSQYRPVRPLPAAEDWFETVWGAYRDATARTQGR